MLCHVFWSQVEYKTVCFILKEITSEMHPILAETDISKTAIRKIEENVSKIINIMKSVSNSFKFNVNKQDEDRT